MSLPWAPASRRKPGGEPRVAERQIVLLEYLVGVVGGQSNLGGSDQVEVVAVYLVYLLIVVRKETGPEQRVLADQGPEERPA